MIKNKTTIKNLKVENVYGLVLILFPIVLILSIPFLHQEKIKITEISPQTTIVEEVFNEYEGYATISIKGEGFKDGDIIYVNNEPQVTSFGSNIWMTCTVKEKFYQQPQNLKIRIIRKDSERIILKSNTKVIKVLNNK